MSGSAESGMVVCSVLERDPGAAERKLSEAPAACGLVEIRGDHFDLSELAGVVERAGRPVVATIRRVQDGGAFSGDERTRRRMLLGALEAGARFIDVEWNGELRELASGAHAKRAILSHHGAACEPRVLTSLYREMASTPAALLKIVPRARSVVELYAVRDLLARASNEGRALACFAEGRAGAVSRLLALSWGSWACYGATRRGSETARGQFPASEMLELYDVNGIGPETRRFALVGRSVSGSASPAMHAAAYRHLGLDARYFPVEIDEFEECLPLVGPDGLLGLDGLAVTIPMKEAARARCAECDEPARSSGAVNTVLVRRDGWVGYNTDGPAILQRVRAHLEPAGARVAIVGAGGTARAAAALLRQAGAEVCLFNRDEHRGRRVADELGVALRPWNELERARWDVLVQATPLGGRGETVIPAASLCGRLVLDAVYGPPTPLVRDATRRGLQVVDGLDLLVAQAVLQFELLTGTACDPGILRDAGRAWLEKRERDSLDCGSGASYPRRPGTESS